MSQVYWKNFATLVRSQFTFITERSLFKGHTLLHNQVAKKFINGCKCKLNNSWSILSIQFSRQCKGLLAQRLRRTVQVLRLYEELGYDMNYVKKLLRNLQNALLKNRKDAPFMAVLGAAMFSWNEQQITEDEVQKVEAEMDYVQKKRNTPTSERTDLLEEHFRNEWEIVFKKENLIAWRQPVPGSNVYKYKLYGSIEDIPARAFYHAQIDIDYRKQWDKLILGLDVIDQDKEKNSQVVHWKMHFLYPLYPRDYVFIRKFKVDHEKNLMYTMSHSCLHPKVPISKDSVRVESYFSNMVIRPYKTFDENGFDYILTYYDDPKYQFPSIAYNWIASKGVPDFVEKMYNAARYLHKNGKDNPDIHFAERPRRENLCQ